MKIFIKFCYIFLVCALTFTGLAKNNTHSACQTDAEQFCSDKRGHSKAKCLAKHESSLTVACKEHLGIIKSKRKAVKSACEADAKKFCAEIKPGNQRVRQCLKTHKSELASACLDAVKNAKSDVDLQQ